MTVIATIIFDLGGVLIDWNPRYVFDENYFDSIATRDYFLEDICTMNWNEQQDAGYSIAQGVAEKIAEYPEWKKAITDYYGRWEEMLKGPIDETVELFKILRKKEGLKLYALTNWSAELFPVALERFDFLHWFDGRVVSGEEKIRKPFPEIYQRLLEKYNVDPSKALFIDDSLRNVKAAENLGIMSIHFKNAGDLREKLQNLQLI